MRGRKRRRGRGKSGLGLGAASPWAGPEQVLGASAAGGRREGLHPASSRSPLLPTSPCPCPLAPAYRSR